MRWRHQDRDQYDEHYGNAKEPGSCDLPDASNKMQDPLKEIIPSMIDGKLIKFNMPKLFSELQLMALFDAGETSINTTEKEITLKVAFIINLKISE